MGSRKHNGLELVASMPWPAGIVLGIVAYIGLRHGVALFLSNSASPITQQIGQAFSNGALMPLAWMVLAICWLGALLSYLASRKRARLLETQTGLDSLRAMNWREFELLVGEAFRRQGYSVEETGLGGADGGVDLILRKNGRTELVQCKQWRREQINVSVVREMWGLVHHHRADAVKIVAVGEFTRDAAAFARDKAIDLINGEKLLVAVRDSQATPALQTRIEPTLMASIPSCPLCGKTMTQRSKRATGQSFWGCSSFPRCKGTRPYDSHPPRTIREE
jgi:restriction system protein